VAVGTVAEAAAHINLTLFGLHDLRHLYASKLFAAGIPVRQVAQRIGDTEKTTERHYVHFLPHESADDLEAIAAIQ
jgi:integrase